jgi:hypothetical protein
MSPVRLYYNHCILELYDGDNVERLHKCIKNSISVYSSFLSFVGSFQLIKSSKYTTMSSMMCSTGLYYEYCMLELFGHELCTNMNTNALKTALV